MPRKLSLKGKIRDQRGFTLIEIIAVLVILAVLAVVAVPKYMSVIADARNKAAMGAVAEGMGRVSMAVASYMLANNGANPTPANVLTIVNTAAYQSSGEFQLMYGSPDASHIGITASGTLSAGNAYSGSATGTVMMPQ